MRFIKYASAKTKIARNCNQPVAWADDYDDIIYVKIDLLAQGIVIRDGSCPPPGEYIIRLDLGPIPLINPARITILTANGLADIINLEDFGIPPGARSYAVTGIINFLPTILIHWARYVDRDLAMIRILAEGSREYNKKYLGWELTLFQDKKQ